MNIETLTVGAFAMNCYLLTDSRTMDAILIDPGAEADRIINHITAKGIKLRYIINTHCHIDHAAELHLVQEHFKVPFYIHNEEMPLLEALPQQGRAFGIEVGGLPAVSGFVEDGDEIDLGKHKGRIIHTPGHSPGGISILFADHVFVGDCLFMDSIGRTDLYKGDYNVLICSIKDKLLILDADTSVYPGHGPPTTIGREKTHNPFLE